MFVYKNWKDVKRGGSVRYICDGWFLFGFIPLYVRKINVDLPVTSVQQNIHLTDLQRWQILAIVEFSALLTVVIVLIGGR